jgi:hypothetical protein
MKTFTIFMLVLLPSFAFAVDTFNGQTGELHMPNVVVGDNVYDVTMAHQGNYNFQLTLATQVSFPTQFSMEWLQGKTLYDVWHETTSDASGNDVPGTAAVSTFVFGQNGILQVTGLLNSFESLQGAYQVDDTGALSFNNEPDEFFKIVDHTASCLIAQYFDGGLDDIDYFCFNEQDAFDLAKALTHERSTD